MNSSRSRSSPSGIAGRLSSAAASGYGDYGAGPEAERIV
jgi:hypothetical protein